MPTFNPFDQYGRVRPLDSEDDTAIETLPGDQRDALMACIAASLAADAGEDRLTGARKSRDIKNRAHDEALAAFTEANPPVTHHQALAAVSAANMPGYKSPPTENDETRAALLKSVADLAASHAKLTQAAKDEKASAAGLSDKTRNALAKVAGQLATARADKRYIAASARAALATAITELAEARAEVNQAEAALRILSAKRGEALLAYMNSGEKITDEHVAREYQARSQAQRQAVADGTAPKKVEPIRLSELDRSLSARGMAANRTQKFLGAR
jgi:hypothetical protein